MTSDSESDCSSGSACGRNTRREQARIVRQRAAELADQLFVENEQEGGSRSNGEDQDEDLMLISSFTKGMRHNDDSSIVNPYDYRHFVNVIVNTGLPEQIAELPLGPARSEDDDSYVWRSPPAQNGPNGAPVQARGWESMTAGNAFSLIGPDAQSVSMPPVPLLTSDEVISEMGELYAMALCRDIPISEWGSNKTVAQLTSDLNQLTWFANPDESHPTDAENARRRGNFTVDSVFRGILPGSKKGPYLSQFLISGSRHLGGPDNVNAADLNDGYIRYGANVIDTRVRIAVPGLDYLTDMPTFLDAQDGADLRYANLFQAGQRRITTLRDLATYVHYDALYQAYLNACLTMLAGGYPVDPDLPFNGPDYVDKQEGFSLFGAPHVLTLVCECATRALKAVRYQKFNVHRRGRPEALGGLLNMHKTTGAFPQVAKIAEDLEPFLARVAEYNAAQNEADDNRVNDESYLLPMAFAEGSPNHPAYGSGHATVAGAAVTILKAFFDEDYEIETAYQVNADGEVEEVQLPEGETLTVGSELEKLADNISIGRDAAGVHWFSDQWESLLLGERVAIQLLRETQLTLHEEFSFNLTKFNGEKISLRREQPMP